MPDDPLADSTVTQVTQLAVAQLRSRREEKGISVRALARRIGISPSLVSQIENGKVNPSVGTLVAITTELKLSLAELFADPERETERRAPEASPDSPVLRSTGRPSFKLESGVSWNRLTPRAEEEVDFLYTVYEVGGASCPPGAPMRHHGREYGLVLAGHLGATVGFESFALGPGDSIVFNSDTPHRLWTIGDEPAVVVWTVIGRGGDGRAASGEDCGARPGHPGVQARTARLATSLSSKNAAALSAAISSAERSL